jgi:hypothetical protein
MVMRRPIAWVLAQIVARNYRARIAGKAPDRWHWADILLVKLGYATDEHGRVTRFP